MKSNCIQSMALSRRSELFHCGQVQWTYSIEWYNILIRIQISEEYDTKRCLQGSLLQQLTCDYGGHRFCKLDTREVSGLIQPKPREKKNEAGKMGSAMQCHRPWSLMSRPKDHELQCVGTRQKGCSSQKWRMCPSLAFCSIQVLKGGMMPASNTEACILS